ncbi:hypothetical protein PR048_020975 [Dryococelus australis]|uniref:Uncharacterized protein n=1 Tax=Dryococelus australis TaxID=614101 RepID=A0ABQ9GWX7_9NEOP|nr:hypothetical protein PR048_020975 [Dryococelus australis]
MFQIVLLLKAAYLYNIVSTEFREGEQDTNWGMKDTKVQRYIKTTIDKGHVDRLCSIMRDIAVTTKVLCCRISSTTKITRLNLVFLIYKTFPKESTLQSDRALTNLTARLLAEEDIRQ